MKEQFSNLNIKFKLILGYSLTVLAVIVAAFFSYASFTKLLDSVEELTDPNIKLTKLNKILTDISQAESSTRSYILTRDKSYLDNYYEYVASIKDNIKQLKVLSQPYPAQYVKVDSIDRLFDEKVESLNSFIDLKQRRQDTDFSSKALRQITKNTQDSAKRTTTLTTTTEITTIKPYGPLGKKENEEKGLFDIIKKIFTKKEEDGEIAVQDQEPEVLTETKVTIDTTITSDYQPDTVLLNVKKILSQLRAQESRFNRLLTKKELEMLKKDNLIMTNIMTIIRDLENEEKKVNEEKAAESKAVADKFSKTILIIGIVALTAGIFFIILILHDVNKSNFYKKQLLAAKRHAEKLARIKEEFLSNMSHEIRTPLNAIIGFSEQLSGTRLSNKQQDYLRAVRNSSEHLLSTVNDILDFQKIEAGKLTIEKIPFKVDHAIKDVFDSLKLKADAKNLYFSYSIEEKIKKITLLGDPFRLKQILFNLVSNAVKFTDEGYVKISCYARSVSGQRCLITIDVEDTGIGIPEEKAHYIFEGFSQADATTTRKYGGTGLGLSISKKLVEMQEGKINLESTPGRGSLFSIEIPYEVTERDLTKPVHKMPDHLPHTSSLEGKQVLIVDDDKFNASLACTILEKWNMACEIASNGKDAIQLIKQNNYSIVITDLNMPEMSGIDLTRAVRAMADQAKASVPIIALTATVSKREQKHLINSGMNDLLIKPFKEADLYHKIIHYFEGKPTIAGNVQGNSKQEDKEETMRYNLDDFKSFSGGDEELMLTMVQTLVEEQTNNIKRLKEALSKKNLPDIGMIAHKMIPSFAYLKAKAIAGPLREIDVEIKNRNYTEELLHKTRMTLREAENLVILLSEEILKKEDVMANDK